MKSFFRLVLMALVLVVVALASALTAMRYAIHGREVAVPKLLGMTPAQAEKLLAAKGLMLDTQRRFYSPDVPEGRVMSQVPDPGTLVRRGWRVRIAESLGPQRVTIPDILGQSSRAAEINIRRWGLELGTVAAVELPDLPPNQVVAQSPPPNASGIASPKISLLETAPPEPPAYVMPDFVGRPLAAARQAVKDAGFTVGAVTLFSPAPPLAPAAASGPSVATTPPATSAQPPTSPAPPTPSPATPAPAITPNQPPPPISPIPTPSSTPTQLLPQFPPQSSPQPEFSPSALIVAQNPPAGQKVIAGSVVTFQVNQ